MLRATRRLLRRGGRTAFYTIHPAPGLTERQRRRASRDGPVAVATPRSHRELLAAAGFVDLEETDCSSDFATTTRAWIDQFDLHRDHLVELLGEAAFDERQADRRVQLAAIEDGILQRSLFVAQNPA